MTDLERSHRDLRATVIATGRYLRRKLGYSREANALRAELRRVLVEARAVARSSKFEVRTKL